MAKPREALQRQCAEPSFVTAVYGQGSNEVGNDGLGTMHLPCGTLRFVALRQKARGIRPSLSALRPRLEELVPREAFGVELQFGTRQFAVMVCPTDVPVVKLDSLCQRLIFVALSVLPLVVPPASSEFQASGPW